MDRPAPAIVAETFGRLWEELAVEAGDLLPDAWRSHLVGRLLDDENLFSLTAERRELAPNLVEQTRRDLATLQALFDLDAEALLGLVEEAVSELEGCGRPGETRKRTPNRRVGTSTAGPWPASSRR